MTTQLESQRRLDIARRYLEDARAAESTARLRDAAAAARACIENACKAVIARFGAVPRTHEPKDVLQKLLSSTARLTPVERPLMSDLIRISQSYGVAAHMALSYGDEKTGQTPWDLVSETSVQQSLADATEVLAKADTLTAPVRGAAP